MGLFNRFLFIAIYCLFTLGLFDGNRSGVEALVIFPAYRMKSLSQRPQTPWNLDYRFNRPRALYQSMVKRSVKSMKRERVLDALGGDYLIRKRTFLN